MKLSPSNKNRNQTSIIKRFLALFGTGITVVTLASCMKLGGDPVTISAPEIDSTNIEDNNTSSSDTL